MVKMTADNKQKEVSRKGKGAVENMSIQYKERKRKSELKGKPRKQNHCFICREKMIHYLCTPLFPLQSARIVHLYQ